MDKAGRRNFLKKSAGLFIAMPFSNHFKASFQEIDRPKILLRTGWDPTDNDDIATISALYRLIQKLIVGTEIIIWPDKMDDSIVEMLNDNFTQMKIVTGDISKEGEPSTDELKTTLAETNLLFYSPGAQNLIDWTGTDEEGIETNSLKYCKENSIPYILYGLGSIPEESNSVQKMVEYAENATFVYITDSFSEDILKDRKIKLSKAEYSLYPLYAFDLRNEKDSKSFLEEKGLFNKNFLTIDFRTKGIPTASIEKYAITLREIITDWILETNKDVLILPNDDDEIESCKLLLYDLLPEADKSKVHFTEERLRPDIASSVYEKARIITSMSLFPVCSAVFSGLPIYYYADWKIGSQGHSIKDIGLKNSVGNLEKTSSKDALEIILGYNNSYVKSIIEADEARESANKKIKPVFENINKYVSKNFIKKKNKSKDKSKDK